MRQRGLVMGIAMVLVACTGTGGSTDVLAPPPARHFGAAIEPPPALPATVVDLPLLIDLRTAVDLLEKNVPRTFGNIDKRLPIPGKKRANYAYQLRRDPFRISVTNDTFVIASTIHYQGKGWYKAPIVPEVGGSCGTGDQQPRARVAIAFQPRIDRDWRLRAQPRLAYLGPLTKTDRDQCKVTFLNFDVTAKVLAAARGALKAELPRMAKELAGLNVRGEVEKVWEEIQHPIRLTDSVWLVLQPEGVRLGSLSGTKEMLGGTIGISAHPKIETGLKPSVGSVALPPLDPASGANGLNLLVEGRFDYPLISANLSKALQGRQISTAGGTIKLEELGAFGIGAGRLALGVRFTGSVSGQIYFVGTPRYDDSTRRITVPDLDYDASTTSILVKSLGWLKSDAIRDYLRAQATFPSNDVVEKLASLAIKGMNRELTKGIFLTATLTRTHVLGLLPRADALYLQARTEGEAALHVTDGFFGRFGKPTGSDTNSAAVPGRTANPGR